MSTDLYHDLNTAQVMPSEDWTYTMHRSLQEIVPGVFLGPYAVGGQERGEEREGGGVIHRGGDGRRRVGGEVQGAGQKG